MMNQELSYTELKRALQGGLVNPKKDKQARLLLSSGNQEYFLQRAMEELQQAQINLEEAGSADLRIKSVNTAMLLLAAFNAMDTRAPI